MTLNSKTVRRDHQDRRILGCTVAAIGLAHFVFPKVFDPINRLGFPRHPRTFTYINGGIESVMGVLMANRRTRRQATILSTCYVIHLTVNIIRAQTMRRAATATRTDGTD